MIKSSILFVFFILAINTHYAQLSASQKIAEVYSKITGFYVDSVNEKEITESAIVAMLETLDPHSTYIPKRN